MRIFGRKNIDFVIAKSVTFSSKTLSKMLFCNQDHHQTLFLVVFLAGGNNEKFKFSHNNYVFTPLEKWDFLDIKNCLVYSLKSFFFILEHHQAPFRRRTFTKNK